MDWLRFFSMVFFELEMAALVNNHIVDRPAQNILSFVNHAVEEIIKIVSGIQEII